MSLFWSRVSFADQKRFMLYRLPSFHRSTWRRPTATAPSTNHTPRIALAACALLALTIALPVAPTAPVAAETPLATEATPAPARITPAPVAKKPVAVAAPAVASGPVTGGTVVTVTGEELTKVSAVQVGGVPAAVVEATATSLSYQVPVAADQATGTVAVELFDVTGTAVPITADPAEATMLASAGSIALEAEPAVPLAVEPGTPQLRELIVKPSSDPAAASAAAEASVTPSAPAMLSFEYLPDPRVTAQSDYVLRHWNNYNPEYNAIYGNDCVNFTSQGLLARGWTMDAEWNYNGAGSSAWISSTAFRDYMANHPERGVALDDSQRSEVKVGDIAQFDWDNSGDRDHTATVTRVDKSEYGVTIYVAGHSKDSDYWNVDEAIAGGGSVHYWSLY